MASRFFEGTQLAALYSQFRPVTPDIVITKIISFLKEKVSSLEHAVDVGCGSGQSSKALAPHFEKVTGIDLSEAQISEAKNNNDLPNVEYRLCPAEKIPLKDGSLQLVTACQSVHWFNIPDFYKEVDRLLVPSGVLALYGYDLPMPVHSDESVTLNARKIVREYYGIMMEHFPQQRELVDSHYKDIELPYKDSIRTTVTAEKGSRFCDYLGYITSWSAYHRMKAQNPEKAEFEYNRFCNRLKEALSYPPSEMPLQLSIDYFILMGRKGQ